MRKIVVTRTGGDAEDYAAAIRVAGYLPLFEPLLDIAFTDADMDAHPETPLIFTSSHGVQAFAARNAERAHPVYTVGDSTAKAALEAGFEKVESASGTVEDLVSLLIQKAKTGLRPPIYVRGAEISRDLREILKKSGIFIGEIIAYKANPIEKLSIPLLKSMDNREIYAVMLFSGRGGAHFAALMEQYGRAVRLKQTKALCLSEAVLQSVSVLPFQQALVAGTPDRHGMLELIETISVKVD